MPYFGLSSFLPAWSYERNQTTCKFQCPTSGFLLFYLIVTYRIIFTEIKFQCPTSGFLLFYVSQTLPVLPVSKVSMPYLGLSSFLSDNLILNHFSRAIFPIHILATFCSILFVFPDIFILTWYLPFCNSKLFLTKLSVLKYVLLQNYKNRFL